ncbi:hypothetical protein F4859DRAFT_497539 [Xylaria cf. heliscus]|nr:hypothetical protein F4859DRAFT_497539 [Xylaria cf. heliscus]
MDVRHAEMSDHLVWVVWLTFLHEDVPWTRLHTGTGVARARQAFNPRRTCVNNTFSVSAVLSVHLATTFRPVTHDSPLSRFSLAIRGRDWRGRSRFSRGTARSPSTGASRLMAHSSSTDDAIVRYSHCQTGGGTSGGYVQFVLSIPRFYPPAETPPVAGRDITQLLEPVCLGDWGRSRRAGSTVPACLSSNFLLGPVGPSLDCWILISNKENICDRNITTGWLPTSQVEAGLGEKAQ